MQQTIFAILTNKQVRSRRIVEMTLDKEFTVGIPWFNRTVTELQGTKTGIVV